MIPPNIRRILAKRRAGKRLTSRERQALRRFYARQQNAPAAAPPPPPPVAGRGPGRGRLFFRRPPAGRNRPPLPPGLRPGRLFPGRRLLSRQMAGIMPLYALPDDDE